MQLREDPWGNPLSRAGDAKPVTENSVGPESVEVPIIREIIVVVTISDRTEFSVRRLLARHNSEKNFSIARNHGFAAGYRLSGAEKGVTSNPKYENRKSFFLLRLDFCFSEQNNRTTERRNSARKIQE